MEYSAPLGECGGEEGTKGKGDGWEIKEAGERNEKEKMRGKGEGNGKLRPTSFLAQLAELFI